MTQYLKLMTKTFKSMFPGFDVKSVKEHENGAGIILTLTNGQKLIFSYKSERLWWLRTI